MKRKVQSIPWSPGSPPLGLLWCPPPPPPVPPSPEWAYADSRWRSNKMLAVNWQQQTRVKREHYFLHLPALRSRVLGGAQRIFRVLSRKGNKSCRESNRMIWFPSYVGDYYTELVSFLKMTCWLIIPKFSWYIEKKCQQEDLWSVPRLASIAGSRQ